MEDLNHRNDSSVRLWQAWKFLLQKRKASKGQLINDIVERNEYDFWPCTPKGMQ